ncbi:MAG: hypothetical protein P9L99_17985 [Candidatus Lernaella stagnicola]|nr:hypothetical protein [Candidatus Lernaella stagnicola]
MRLTIIGLISMVLLPVMIGCGDAEQPQVASLGGGNPNDPVDGDGDGNIDEVPDGVNDLFTPEQLEAFRSAGLPLYFGDEPPTVDGGFGADSLQIVYDDLDLSLVIVAYLFEFSEQTAAGRIGIAYQGGADSSSDNNAFIAGSEGCFSVYADISGYSAVDDCEYRRPTIYSACLEGGHLHPFVFGFVITDTDGDCSQTLPVGHSRIINESDGYAMRQ